MAGDSLGQSHRCGRYTGLGADPDRPGKHSGPQVLQAQLSLGVVVLRHQAALTIDIQVRAAGGAGLGIACLAQRAGSAVVAGGIGDGVAHLAVASNDLRLMDACIGAVDAKGCVRATLTSQPGPQWALTGAILGHAAQGGLPVRADHAIGGGA